jgi:hypothetical protein
MKNIIEKIKYGVCASALGLSMVLLPPADITACEKEKTPTNENYIIRPLIELGADFQISGSIGGVKNVPEEIRYVPIHSNDSDVPESNNGVIKEDSAKIHPVLFDMRFLKLGLESKLSDNVYLDVYGDLSVNFSKGKKDLNIKDDLDRVNERNYRGVNQSSSNYSNLHQCTDPAPTPTPGTNERGTGTALTYYGLKYDSLFIPGIKADLRFRSGDNEFIIGGGIRQYKLDIETGWDRYDDLEKYTEYDIGDVQEKSIYLGYRFIDPSDKGWSGTIKAGINRNDLKSKEGNIDIENKTTLFMDLGASYRF